MAELKKSLDFSEESLSLKSLDIEQLSRRDIRYNIGKNKLVKLYKHLL
ncbi:hypothetical protein [Borreliella garinii]|nr:hypothetical protein [Borreliella garinii]